MKNDCRHEPHAWMFGCQKDLVQLYWTGYYSLPIHGRDPATARHGDFCLLRFRPGPVRLSLVNLDAGGSPPPTILMPGLARTPGRHRPVNGRCPALKLSTDPGLPVAGLQEHATTPGRLQTILITSSIVQPVFLANRSHVNLRFCASLESNVYSGW